MAQNIPTEQSRSPMDHVPFFSSLQVKYTLSSLLILAIVLVLLNTFPLVATEELLFRSKVTSLSGQTAVISSALIELETLTNPTVARVIELLEVSGLSRLIVTDPVGEVLYDSTRTDQILQGEYFLAQEIVVALYGNDVVRSEFLEDRVFSTSASPIVYNDTTIGAIYAQEIDFQQGQLLQSLKGNLQTITLVAALLASTFCGVISLLLSQRIGALLSAIRIVGEGEYGHRLLPKGRDEMAFLAQEFNTLTDHLQSTEEVRRRFVSDASHELRTPLASIRLLADSILQNQPMDSETLQEFVGDIGNEAERLTRITERLLALSQLDSLPAPVAERVSINPIIKRVIQSLEGLAEEHGVSIVFAPPEAHRIFCNGDKFHQICYNLIENSIKYSPDGGVTTVSVHQQGAEILIEVADTGIGIPEKECSKVFNRFYRVDDARSRQTGGTGLGLAIVRDTVRSYGGWIDVEQNHPKGTIFTVGLKGVLEVRDEED